MIDNGAQINVLLAIREHVNGDITATRAAIEASEKQLGELRQHLHSLLAIREAAGVQDPDKNLPKPEVTSADAVS